MFLKCRHSEDMIRKLESAGLGFYVQVSETQQKLGTSTMGNNDILPHACMRVIVAILCV